MFTDMTPEQIATDHNEWNAHPEVMAEMIDWDAARKEHDSLTLTASEIAGELIALALANGGCTRKLERNQLVVVHHGFVVGGRASTIVLTPQRAELHEWASNDVVLTTWADQNRNQTLGSWTDDRGRVWLDVVDVLRDRDEALSLARARGELAIFDLDTFTEISVS